MIVKTGIFGILHEKLLDLSPPPPIPLLSSNYFSLDRLCCSLESLVKNNSEGVDIFLQTLQSVTSIVETSHTPNTNVVNIQEYICGCFLACTFYSYEQAMRVVRCEVIPSLLILLEKYMNMMKEKGKEMGEWVVRYAI
jgi:hypothetical protein